jgi:hypothetical protein
MFIDARIGRSPVPPLPGVAARPVPAIAAPSGPPPGASLAPAGFPAPPPILGAVAICI